MYCYVLKLLFLIHQSYFPIQGVMSIYSEVRRWTQKVINTESNNNNLGSYSFAWTTWGRKSKKKVSNTFIYSNNNAYLVFLEPLVRIRKNEQRKEWYFLWFSLSDSTPLKSNAPTKSNLQFFLVCLPPRGLLLSVLF